MLLLETQNNSKLYVFIFINPLLFNGCNIKISLLKAEYYINIKYVMGYNKLYGTETAKQAEICNFGGWTKQGSMTTLHWNVDEKINCFVTCTQM